MQESNEKGNRKNGEKKKEKRIKWEYSGRECLDVFNYFQKKFISHILDGKTEKCFKHKGINMKITSNPSTVIKTDQEGM